MRWIIPVSELARLAKELRKDGMDYVELDLDEGSPIPSAVPSPPCISFSGFKKSEPEFPVEYGEIEVVADFNDVEVKGGRSRF